MPESDVLYQSAEKSKQKVRLGRFRPNMLSQIWLVVRLAFYCLFSSGLMTIRKECFRYTEACRAVLTNSDAQY
jgi:hypothetical protein